MDERILETRSYDAILLKKLSDVKQGIVTIERAFKLTSPKIIWTNKRAFRSDLKRSGFECRDHSSRETFIDYEETLLRDACTVSRRQAEFNELSTCKKHISTKFRPVARPPRYDRSGIVKVRDLTANGKSLLVDCKGVGVAKNKTPGSDSYNNGLLYLHSAIEEVIWQSIVDQSLAMIFENVYTLPTYAIAITGFSAHHPLFGKCPTAILFRRAHSRCSNGRDIHTIGSEEITLCEKIETGLRVAGVSSAHPRNRYTLALVDGAIKCTFGKQVYWRRASADINSSVFGRDSPKIDGDVVNIQLTKHPNRSGEAILVDFGHYRKYHQADYNLISLALDQPFFLGRITRSNDLPQVRWPMGEVPTKLAPICSGFGNATDMSRRDDIGRCSVELARKLHRCELNNQTFAAEVAKIVRSLRVAPQDIRSVSI